MGNASLFISGCKRLQIATFSLFIKEGCRWSRVRGENLPFGGVFWHWILIIPSGNIFLERKGQNHSLHFLYPPAQLLNFFPQIALPVSKEEHVPMQWWTFVGYPSHSQPIVLAHHHSPRVPGFCLGMQERKPKPICWFCPLATWSWDLSWTNQKAPQDSWVRTLRCSSSEWESGGYEEVRTEIASFSCQENPAYR